MLSRERDRGRFVRLCERLGRGAGGFLGIRGGGIERKKLSRELRYVL